MIKKSQLKFGDILITNNSDERYKYYIFCNTYFGPFFISIMGCLKVSSFNENLQMINPIFSSYDFIKVLRPPAEIAHTYQYDSFAFKHNIKISIREMIQKSVDITEGTHLFIDNFINIEDYL